ncbi:MAG: hypothetical protein ACRDBG_28345 [Waterburya sp.]
MNRIIYQNDWFLLSNRCVRIQFGKAHIGWHKPFKALNAKGEECIQWKNWFLRHWFFHPGRCRFLSCTEFCGFFLRVFV